MIQRPQFLTYRAFDDTEHFIVLDYMAGCQAAHREADVFGVIIIASGGASLVISDALTEQQANALVEYLKNSLKPETVNRGSALNLNKLIARIKSELPDKQLIVPDDSVVPFQR